MDLSEIKEKLSDPIQTRFAPSPTGFLHLGHVVSALYVWNLARALGGKVNVRFEDHDTGRCRLSYEKQILEDLDFLGFLERKETKEIRFQRDDETDYEQALQKLIEKGLVYSCFCSRKEIKKRQTRVREELFYDGFCCHEKKLEEDTVLRLRVLEPQQSFFDYRLGFFHHNIQEQCGDFILRDRTKNWSYQFSTVVSDLKEGVNLVIRGEDILPSTGRQLYLKKILGSVYKPEFYHHPLVLEKNSIDKLSKTKNSLSIKKMKEEGKSSSEILKEAAPFCELIKEFF